MKKLLLALAALVTLGLVGGGVAQATTNMQTGTDVRLGANETVDASYYAAGETVIIEGTVKGDVYCAGQNVEVRGTVEGDVMCAGQEVRIGGTVQGDVRVAAQNIFIDGEVQQSATAMGQMISVDGEIARDATLTGQSVRLDGSVGRDLVTAVERLTLLGTVERNVQAAVDVVSVRDNARIGGNLLYTSYNEADQAEGAEIVGTTERTTPPQEQVSSDPGPYAWLMGAIVTFVLLVPFALIWLAVMPRSARESAEVMRQRWLLSIGLGLLVLIVTPLIAAALMITVIGLPLGLVLLFLWLLALPIAFIMAAYSFGTWLTEKAKWKFQGYEFVALLLGLALLVFISSLPFVGWFIALISIVCGLGGISLMTAKYVAWQYGRQPKEKKKS